MDLFIYLDAMREDLMLRYGSPACSSEESHLPHGSITYGCRRNMIINRLASNESSMIKREKGRQVRSKDRYLSTQIWTHSPLISKLKPHPGMSREGVSTPALSFQTVLVFSQLRRTMVEGLQPRIHHQRCHGRIFFSV